MKKQKWPIVTMLWMITPFKMHVALMSVVKGCNPICKQNHQQLQICKAVLEVVCGYIWPISHIQFIYLTVHSGGSYSFKTGHMRKEHVHLSQPEI